MTCFDYINFMDHGVVVILGSGKTFKSGTMYSLLDRLPRLRDRPKAFFRMPNLSDFPSSLRAYEVFDLWDVRKGSICVLEDANRLFPSRSSSKSVDIQAWLGIISHKDILCFLTVQNTSNTDLAWFRDQDVVVIHKRMSSAGIRYERPEFQSNCEYANFLIDDFSRRTGVDYHLLGYAPRFGELLVIDCPPTWYGYAQSHALRDYDPRLEVLS